MKKFLMMVLVATLTFSGQTTYVGAQDKKSDAAEQYEKALKEFNQLTTDWSAKVRDARAKLAKASPAERAEINKTMVAAQQKLLEKAGKIAEQMKELISADDKQVAFDAISWILSTPYVQDEKIKQAAAAKIVDHVNNKQVSQLLQSLSRGMPSQDIESLFRVVSQKSTVPSVQGLATINLANYLRQNKAQLKDMVKNPAFAKAYPDSIVYFKKLAATKDEDIEALLKKAADKFGDVEYQNSTIGKIASQQLKIIEVQKNLQVGKVAPEIEGPDIDGVNFKLSDYRGKVVLLDFWGDW